MMESRKKVETSKGFAKFFENRYLVFFSWIGLSLVVTLYSKWLMNLYFPYPISMSFIHMLIASVLSHITAILYGNKEGNKANSISTIKELNSSEKKGILIFSIIVAVNIWVSNASLFMVSISLHQVARSTIPLFTMVLGILFFKHSYRLSQIPSVFLVILGVAITVNDSPELSIYGLFVVFLGCCVSSLKGIVAQKLQVDNLNIGPISMLQYVAPMASLTLGFFSFVLGEFHEITNQSKSMDKILIILTSVLLVLAGVLAFVLNILSFKSSSIVTPLAMNIAGNVKQLLTCLFGCLIFGNKITEKLLVGVLLTTLGAFWYSADKQKEAGRKKVRYVKGRYIDRVGLGIPQDRVTIPIKFENKLVASELTEIRTGGRSAAAGSTIDSSPGSTSMGVIGGELKRSEGEGDKILLTSLEILIDEEPGSGELLDEKEERRAAPKALEGLNEQVRIGGKGEISENPGELEFEMGAKVMIIVDENLDSSNREI
ncbi:TPT-domain-containing protein [Cryptosporidium felis]|nr:TPT-domain-containing protein [Cryptosporidium felis]